MKAGSYLCVFLLAVLLFSGNALAHRVNLFAYVEGGIIYTESYFPDGKPVAGGKISVYDSQDDLLLEGTTDKDGLFHFAIPKVDDLTIVIEASMGHKNHYQLKRTEVEAGK